MATESLAVIGATITNEQSSSVSCPNASTTNIATINLPSAGVWMLCGYVQINDPAGTSNTYILDIADSASNFSTNYLCTTCYSNNKNVPARLSVSGVYETTAAKTLYLNVYQESGGAKTATYRGIKATRIA